MNQSPLHAAGDGTGVHRGGVVPLVDEHSPFQHIQVLHHPQFGNQLWLDGDLQVSESDHGYGAAMVAPLFELPEGARVAILGGGDGGVLNKLLRFTEPLGRVPAEVTLIDVDGRVIELARQHLPDLCGDGFDHPVARVLVDDAFAWIEAARGLDAVIYDLTMDPVREDQSRGDFIQEVLGQIAAALKPGGVLSMQCCGHGLDDPADLDDREQLLPLIRAAVDRHFERRVEQAVWVPSYRDLWTFLSARRRSARPA